MGRGFRGLIGAACSSCARCDHTLMDHHMGAVGNCGDFIGESSMKRQVVRVDQSPMNPVRWCLGLDCGHEEYVTAKRRPVRSSHPCGACKAALKAGTYPFEAREWCQDCIGALKNCPYKGKHPKSPTA